MTKERLNELYGISAPTWEGLVLEGLEESLKEIDPKAKYEVCKGKEMNEIYGLTGINAYPEELNIVILTEWSNFTLDWKFKYGCRWLDDIVDNNLMREENV